jgi:hypothetical protein
VCQSLFKEVNKSLFSKENICVFFLKRKQTSVRAGWQFIFNAECLTNRARVWCGRIDAVARRNPECFSYPANGAKSREIALLKILNRPDGPNGFFSQLFLGPASMSRNFTMVCQAGRIKFPTPDAGFCVKLRFRFVSYPVVKAFNGFVAVITAPRKGTVEVAVPVSGPGESRI